MEKKEEGQYTTNEENENKKINKNNNHNEKIKPANKSQGRIRWRDAHDQTDFTNRSTESKAQP